jgi:hypothetical protein
VIAWRLPNGSKAIGAPGSYCATGIIALRGRVDDPVVGCRRCGVKVLAIAALLLGIATPSMAASIGGPWIAAVALRQCSPFSWDDARRFAVDQAFRTIRVEAHHSQHHGPN